jgi:release factor glutamine methyltransferase
MKLRSALLQARRRLEAAGIPDAPLEADLLLRHALWLTTVGSQHAAPLRPAPPLIDRAYLFSHLDNALDVHTAARYEAVVMRRLAREPTAYILGHREFYGLDLLVTPATLIPRPETETLVEAAIDLVTNLVQSPPLRRAERGPGGEVSPVIADIGTGSGAVAIALAVSLPQATIYATDVSPEALEVARENARRHALSRRISIRRGDLLEPVPSYLDLIVANLPYVKEADLLNLEPELREYEPRLALAAGPDGLRLIRRLLHQAPRYLRPGGAVCLEFGYGQSQAVMFLARAALPAASVSLRHDLAGQPRVLIAQP